jgi:hypothetical protein
MVAIVIGLSIVGVAIGIGALLNKLEDKVGS